MSKKQLIQEIIGYIEKMENNTFLLPNSWSEEIQMATRDFAYKTYVGTRGGRDRYINIQVVDGVHIDIRGDTVRLGSIDLSEKQPKLTAIRDIVKAIYEEKHSFADSTEGLTNIRRKITKKRKDIQRCKKELAELNDQLEDYLSTHPKDSLKEEEV